MTLSFARDRTDIAQEARALLSRCGIESPEQLRVRVIAGFLGLAVELVAVDGFAGALLRAGDVGTILVDRKMGEARQRFTVGHEIGHASLHPGTASRHTCGASDVGDFGGKPREREANIFASELLMPADMFLPLISYPPSMENVRDLAKTFRTSLSSSAIRYCDLCGERCAVVFSKKGAIQWAIPSDDFGYDVLRFGCLDSETYAADGFSGKALPVGMRAVPLEAWVEEDVTPRAVVQEESMTMPRLDAVLTLLWLEEPPEEDEEER